jgi:hypothetical protein
MNQKSWLAQANAVTGGISFRPPSTVGINCLQGETERELGGVFRGPFGNYFQEYHRP